MASLPADAPRARHVGPLLATAIVALPPIFFWLLLRRGYARSTRRAALVYTIASMLPGIIAAFAGARP
jgi:hypothetical protein